MPGERRGAGRWSRNARISPDHARLPMPARATRAGEITRRRCRTRNGRGSNRGFGRSGCWRPPTGGQRRHVGPAWPRAPSLPSMGFSACPTPMFRPASPLAGNTINRRAGCGRSARPVVCPAKAGMFSRRQACRGKSQSPVVWIAEVMETETLKPIDKVSPGEATSSPGRNKSKRVVASKMSIPEGRACNRRAKAT